MRAKVAAWQSGVYEAKPANAELLGFLGPTTYRGHVGEKPMPITWELHHPLPGDLYAQFAAAVASGDLASHRPDRSSFGWRSSLAHLLEGWRATAETPNLSPPSPGAARGRARP